MSGTNEEDEEDDKISFLLNEIHIKQEADVVHSNALALETATDLEQELAKFRSDWKKEVTRKEDKSDEGKRPKNVAVYHEFPKRNRAAVGTVSTNSEVVISEASDSESEETSDQKAKYLFDKGVQLEQMNRHYEAIKFYKMALKMDPDIEFKAYGPAPAKPKCEISTPGVEINPANLEPVEESLYEKFQSEILQMNTICTKKSPQSGAHFSSLPIEVVIQILKWVVSDQLDMRSLEIFSMVCKGFYVCARDPELWRLACTKVWGPVTSIESFDSWRSMFLQKPRLNFDGAYISKASYARAGEKSLDNFYSPWHLVEYYRYFRFFSDGTVVFLTCNDEPKNTVTRLKTMMQSGDTNALRGTWTMNDSRIFVHIKKRTVCKRTNTRFRNKSNKENIDNVQTFNMELEVCSDKRRLNNQLNWINYDLEIHYLSLNKKTFTKMDLNKIDFPPFYFSRVKSYQKVANNPLN